jgi:cold shock protein
MPAAEPGKLIASRAAEPQPHLHLAAIRAIWSGLQSQTDGLWRFAAPLSFALLAAPDQPMVGRSMKKEMIMPIGIVKFFNADKGYGFIQPEDGGQDAFVHISAVERAGMSTLDRDQRVSYELETDNRGKTSACNLASA